ncbi:MAG: class I tRNA ligase family protein, partial [Promethearchaeota archaeon]
NLSEGLLKASKNFCNKVWQSSNYVLGNIEKTEKIKIFSNNYPMNRLHNGDRWIISRLNKMIKNVTKFFKEYDYLNAARMIRSFFWDEFCDWYIEFSKVRIYNETESDKSTPISILLHVLEKCLRLLHPIIPFLTEVLWQKLPERIKDGQALIVAKWPEYDDSLINNDLEQDFNLITTIIHEIRRVRMDFNIKPGLKVPLIIQTADKGELVENFASEIISLSHIDKNQFKINGSEVPKHSARIILENLIIYLPLEKLIDLKMEIERVSKQVEKIEQQIQKSEKKLKGPFTQRAKPEIVQKERDNLKQLKDRRMFLGEQLKVLH